MSHVPHVPHMQPPPASRRRFSLPLPHRLQVQPTQGDCARCAGSLSIQPGSVEEAGRSPVESLAG
jgi:hypothetical protein